jgi:hypothetical protein
VTKIRRRRADNKPHSRPPRFPRADIAILAPLTSRPRATLTISEKLIRA